MVRNIESPFKLTPAEENTLKYAKEHKNLSKKEIAVYLKVSAYTLTHRIRGILEKLEVLNAENEKDSETITFLHFLIEKKPKAD